MLYNQIKWLVLHFWEMETETPILLAHTTLTFVYTVYDDGHILQLSQRTPNPKEEPQKVTAFDVSSVNHKAAQKT